MTEITFNKKEIDKAMERLDSFEEKPLREKEVAWDNDDFRYGFHYKDVAQAVDRLKEEIKDYYEIREENNAVFSIIDEIFGDLK